MIDLHLHSNYSDGKQPPAEVVANLAKKGISFGVLSDHDSVGGSKEFIREAEKAGIGTIPGVEMSAYELDAGIHILGYGIDIENKRLLNFFKGQQLERKKVFEKYVALFKKAGFKIDKKLYSEYRRAKSVTKAHVFKLIWSIPENQEICIKGYGLKEKKGAPPPFNFQNPFINALMTFPGQIAYARKKRVSAKEIIYLIHKIGGVAVWAHPGLEMEFTSNRNFFPKVFKNLLSYGIDGLEAYSTASSHTRKWIAYLNALAQKNKLIVTMGTDDHDGRRMGTLKVPQKEQGKILTELLKRI